MVTKAELLSRDLQGLIQARVQARQVAEQQAQIRQVQQQIQQQAKAEAEVQAKAIVEEQAQAEVQQQEQAQAEVQQQQGYQVGIVEKATKNQPKRLDIKGTYTLAEYGSMAAARQEAEKRLKELEEAGYGRHGDSLTIRSIPKEPEPIDIRSGEIVLAPPDPKADIGKRLQATQERLDKISTKVSVTEEGEIDVSKLSVDERRFVKSATGLEPEKAYTIPLATAEQIQESIIAKQKAKAFEERVAAFPFEKLKFETAEQAIAAGYEVAIPKITAKSKIFQKAEKENVFIPPRPVSPQETMRKLDLGAITVVPTKPTEQETITLPPQAIAFPTKDIGGRIEAFKPTIVLKEGRFIDTSVVTPKIKETERLARDVEAGGLRSAKAEFRMGLGQVKEVLPEAIGFGVLEAVTPIGATVVGTAALTRFIPSYQQKIAEKGFLRATAGELPAALTFMAFGAGGKKIGETVKGKAVTTEIKQDILKYEPSKARITKELSIFDKDIRPQDIMSAKDLAKMQRLAEERALSLEIAGKEITGVGAKAIIIKGLQDKRATVQYPIFEEFLKEPSKLKPAEAIKVTYISEFEGVLGAKLPKELKQIGLKTLETQEGVIPKLPEDIIKIKKSGTGFLTVEQAKQLLIKKASISDVNIPKLASGKFTGTAIFEPIELAKTREMMVVPKAKARPTPPKPQIEYGKTLYRAADILPSETLRKTGGVYGFEDLGLARGYAKKIRATGIWEFKTTKPIEDIRMGKAYVRAIPAETPKGYKLIQSTKREWIGKDIVSERLIEGEVKYPFKTKKPVEVLIRQKPVEEIQLGQITRKVGGERYSPFGDITKAKESYFIGEGTRIVQPKVQRVKIRQDIIEIISPVAKVGVREPFIQSKPLTTFKPKPFLDITRKQIVKEVPASVILRTLGKEKPTALEIQARLKALLEFEKRKGVVKIPKKGGYEIFDTKKGKSLIEVMKKPSEAAKKITKLQKVRDIFRQPTKEIDLGEGQKAIQILKEPKVKLKDLAKQKAKIDLLEKIKEKLSEAPKPKVKEGIFIFGRAKVKSTARVGTIPLIAAMQRETIRARQRLSQLQKQKVDLIQAQKPALKPITIQRPIPKVEITPKQAQISLVAAAVRQDVEALVDTAPIQDVMQKLDITLRQTSDLITRLKPPRPKPPEPPPPPPRKPPKTELLKLIPIIEKIKQQGYNVQIRRGEKRGSKFVTVEKNLPRNKALSRLRNILDNYIEASGRIKPARKTTSEVDSLSPPVMAKFRRPYPKSKLPRDTYIEQNRYRLDTPNEVKQISYFKVLAEKKKLLQKKKKTLNLLKQAKKPKTRKLRFL